MLLTKLSAGPWASVKGAFTGGALPIAPGLLRIVGSTVADLQIVIALVLSGQRRRDRVFATPSRTGTTHAPWECVKENHNLNAVCTYHEGAELKGPRMYPSWRIRKALIQTADSKTCVSTGSL